MIKRPDEYGHNNPDYAMVDAGAVRGGGRVVDNLTALYAIPLDLLKERVTKVYVTAEAKTYVLKDIANYNNANGWEVENVGSGGTSVDYSTDIEADKLSTTKLSAIKTMYDWAVAKFAAAIHSHTKADIGLGNVDNTSDVNKPVSTATQTALDGKSSTSHNHTLADLSEKSYNSLTDKPTIPAAYTHPTDDGNQHVPATGTTNNGKVLTAGATAGAMTWQTPASVTPADNLITNAKLAQVATGIIKGRKTAGTGNVEDLLISELTTYSSEVVNYPSSGYLYLKNSNETYLNGVLTNSNTFSVVAPEPSTGVVNESVLIFKIGATIPTIYMCVLPGYLGVVNGSANIVGVNCLFTKNVRAGEKLIINGITVTVSSVTNDNNMFLLF